MSKQADKSSKPPEVQYKELEKKLGKIMAVISLGQNTPSSIQESLTYAECLEILPQLPIGDTFRPAILDRMVHFAKTIKDCLNILGSCGHCESVLLKILGKAVLIAENFEDCRRIGYFFRESYYLHSDEQTKCMASGNWERLLKKALDKASTFEELVWVDDYSNNKLRKEVIRRIKEENLYVTLQDKVKLYTLLASDDPLRPVLAGQIKKEAQTLENCADIHGYFPHDYRDLLREELRERIEALTKTVEQALYVHSHAGQDWWTEDLVEAHAHSLRDCVLVLVRPNRLYKIETKIQEKMSEVACTFKECLEAVSLIPADSYQSLRLQLLIWAANKAKNLKECFEVYPFLEKYEERNELEKKIGSEIKTYKDCLAVLDKIKKGSHFAESVVRQGTKLARSKQDQLRLYSLAIEKGIEAGELLSEIRKEAVL